MQYKCVVEVIDKKLFPDLQEKYLKDPKSGVCSFYHVGDRFVFERYGGEDTFWHQDRGNQCAEAWDCISRYIYTALQGGSIMRNWTDDEHIMIASCNDGTRPVIFKIERQDYEVIVANGLSDENKGSIEQALRSVDRAKDVDVRIDKGWIEVFCDRYEAPDPAKLIEQLPNEVEVMCFD